MPLDVTIGMNDVTVLVDILNQIHQIQGWSDDNHNFEKS